MNIRSPVYRASRHINTNATGIKTKSSFIWYKGGYAMYGQRR